MKGNLYILVGIPGAGKSTIAKDLNKSIRNSKIFSSDKYREQLFGEEGKQYSDDWLKTNGYDINLNEASKISICNNYLFYIMYDDIEKALKRGTTVIYDCANLLPSNRINIVDTFRELAETIYCCIVAYSLDKCLEQNKKRTRILDEDYIKYMANQFVYPDYSEGYDEIITFGNKRNIDYGRGVNP